MRARMMTPYYLSKRELPKRMKIPFVKMKFATMAGLSLLLIGISACDSSGAAGVDFWAAGVHTDNLTKLDGSAWTTTTSGNVSALKDLSDVIIAGPSVNQTLVYNGSKWMNANVPTSLGAHISLGFLP